MKIKHALAITLLFLIPALFLCSVIAKDNTQWKLPEGAKARLGKGWIKSISFSPDGTRIAVASSTGIWIYNAHTGSELRMLRGHESGVISVAFSPDNRTLASGGYGDILLWDVDTGKILQSFKGHKGQVGVGAINDDKTLLSASYDGSVRLWDITTGRQKRVFRVTPSLGITKFFLTLIGRDATSWYIHLSKINENGILALGYRKGIIQLKDATTGRHLKTLRGHKDYVNQLAISPDGSLLAVDIFNAPLSLWDITTGRQLKTLSKSGSLGGTFEFSKDGKTFIYQSFRGIELWDIDTGTLRATLGKQMNEISALTFSPDAKTLVGAKSDGTIRFWDADTGVELSALTTGHTQGLNALAFSPDGKTLAGGYSKTIQLWDTNTFTERSGSPESTDKLITLIFSPDGRTITSAGDFTFSKQKRDKFRKESVFGNLSVWDAHTAHKLSVFRIESHTGEAPVLPGQRDVSSSSGSMGGYARIVDVKTTNSIKKHVKYQSHGTAAFSRDGAMFAAAQNSSRATGNDRFSILLWEVPSRQLQLTLKGHKGEIKALVFAFDGKTLASGSKDGTIRLWDTSTGDQTTSFSSDLNTALAFSADGKTFASTHNKGIKLWDITTGNELRSLKGDIGICYALAFSADSKILASGSHDGTIFTWDVATGSELTTFKGHENWIKALTFSPDGKTLASGSEDGAIFLWDFTFNAVMRMQLHF